MRIIIHRFFSSLLTVVGLSVFASSPVMAEAIKWTGCGISKKAYINEVAKAYEAKKGISLDISGGGATKGIRATKAGTTDVGGSCRLYLRGVNDEVHPDERDVEFFHVAWDALVVITNKQNPLENIAFDDLKKVYSGKINNWSDLGQGEGKIALITRDGKYSGVGHTFRNLVFGDQEYDFSALSLKVKSTGPLEKKVAKLKSALAIDGISSAKKADVKIVSIDGVEPSKANIGSGAYVLYRPLYLTLNKKVAKDSARDFINFVLSDEGQAIISEQGTVSLKEGEALVEKWKSRGYHI